jgi:hypothetical protein
VAVCVPIKNDAEFAFLIAPVRRRIFCKVNLLVLPTSAHPAFLVWTSAWLVEVLKLAPDQPIDQQIFGD